MKAIRRNVLLALIVSTFAFFGAMGGKPLSKTAEAKLSTQQIAAKEAESTKETLTCLSVGILAWGLCFWRCAVINRRISLERDNQRRFSEYMRTSAYQRVYR